MARRSRRGFVRSAGAAAVVVASGASGCLRPGSLQEPTERETAVAVGSKTYVEQRILGYLALERLAGTTDLRLIDKISLGGSRRNWNALQSGSVGCYWEYTGTQWAYLPPQHNRRVDDPDTLHQRVSEDAADLGVTVLPRATYDNPFVLVTTREWRAEHGVTTLSELARHLNAGNTDVSLAFGLDWFRRPDGWNLFRRSYGIDPDIEAELEARDNVIIVSLGLTYELLADGDADVVTGFNTDAQLDRDEFVVLEDDGDFFPTYNPAPMVNTSLLERVPEIREALAVLGPALGREAEIRQLNASVVTDGQTPREAAIEFLEREGLR